MISTAEFRNGTRIELDKTPYAIVEFQHVKPGKGGAFVRTKLKNVKTGQVLDKTFRSGEKFDEPDIDECTLQFLYAGGGSYTFMDTSSYEQFTYEKTQLGDMTDLLKEETHVNVMLYKGAPISMVLPTFMELKVVKTDPGFRGDTATGGTKPAEVETGATVKVPLYMEVGEVIKIDTRTREYVERVRT